MIGDARITDYIHSLDSGFGDLCSQIEDQARRDRVPIVRPETGALLQTLVAARQPENILEIGTAVGYSALLMAQVMPESCVLTTIEKYEKRIPQARENFRRARMENRIVLLEGDAGERLKELRGRTFELIFMDAAKGQYLGWLPDILNLLAPAGLLVSDNVLQDGDIVQSRFAVERRNRTIHSRMREYLYELKHNRALKTAILPLGDGVALSARV